MDQTPENPTEYADPGGPAWMPEQEGEHGPQFGRGSPRGFAAPAWVVIVLMALLAILLPHLIEEPEEEAGDPMGVLLMQFQSKSMVGMANSPLAAGQSSQVYGQAKALKAGSVDQRQRFVILAAELAGAAEAKRILDELDGLIREELAKNPQDPATAGSPEPGQEVFELNETQKAIQAILHKLYDPAGEGTGTEAEEAERPRPAVSALTDAERNLLVNKLDWFGRLALHPPEDAAESARADVVRSGVRVFHILAGAMGGAAVVCFGGFVGLIILLVLACLRNLRDGVQPGHAHHGLYAETFAVWMVVFFGLQLVAGAVAVLAPSMGMVLVLGGFFASLAALAWPVIRGASWGQVRRDIGWTLGRAPLAEPLIGVGGYAMALPLLGIGVLLTFLLMMVQGLMTGEPGTFESAAGPAHPVILELAGGSWWPKIQVLVLAAVAAPIVEETMFRGVLYRHLRDATRNMGIWASVLISATINGFVFASIHPQGWVAIPALMSLAYAFIMLREWRGTVIPSMIVHGISNGLVMGMVIFLLGA